MQVEMLIDSWVNESGVMGKLVLKVCFGVISVSSHLTRRASWERVTSIKWAQ